MLPSGCPAHHPSTFGKRRCQARLPPRLARGLSPEEAKPSVHRVGVLTNGESPFTKPFLAQIELNAQGASIGIQVAMLRPGEEFRAAFARMQESQVDAVIIQPSLLRKEIAGLALKHRSPLFTMIPREWRADILQRELHGAAP